jgi:hypothetical protein
MKKSMNEHISRMKYLSSYNGKTRMNEDMQQAPAGQPAPAAQPAQGQQPVQQNPQQQAQADAAMEKEMVTALNQVMNDLPNELRQADTNRDGQLELAGQPAQGQQPAGQPTAQTQPATQPLAEAELKEAIGMLAAGAVLAAPAITNLVGKAASFLGKKIGSGDLNQWGEKAKHFAEKMHHSYEGVIDKILSPLTQKLTPQQRKTANKLVFYAIVATFFGFGAGGALHAAGAGKAGIAAAEGGLSGIKASELVAAARQVIPKILSSLGIS